MKKKRKIQIFLRVRQLFSMWDPQIGVKYILS